MVAFFVLNVVFGRPQDTLEKSQGGVKKESSDDLQTANSYGFGYGLGYGYPYGYYGLGYGLGYGYPYGLYGGYGGYGGYGYPFYGWKELEAWKTISKILYLENK